MPTTPHASALDVLQEQIDTRLTNIEIKQSYSEDLLEQLNLLVYRQQAQIDQLNAQVQRMQQAQGSLVQEAGARDPRDELPPHY